MVRGDEEDYHEADNKAALHMKTLDEARGQLIESVAALYATGLECDHGLATIERLVCRRLGVRFTWPFCPECGEVL